MEKVITREDAQEWSFNHIGDFVNLVVPKVDRGPLDSRNLIRKIADMKNNVYRVGTQYGILKSWFPAIDLQPSGASFCDDIPDTYLSLRPAAQSSKQSKFGGQGRASCKCRASREQCSINRCACEKSGQLCNSRCHSSDLCNNKWYYVPFFKLMLWTLVYQRCINQISQSFFPFRLIFRGLFTICLKMIRQNENLNKIFHFAGSFHLA